jgi:hypothetical protein
VAGVAASVGVEPGQCAACGARYAAEWGITVRRDRDHDVPGMQAYWRLCNPCYRGLMEYLEARPEVIPLRGYT